MSCGAESGTKDDEGRTVYASTEMMGAPSGRTESL